MLKTNISGHHKIWGAQEFWGALTRNAHRGYGLGLW